MASPDARSSPPAEADFGAALLFQPVLIQHFDFIGGVRRRTGDSAAEGGGLNSAPAGSSHSASAAEVLI
jgi:hypothetical protein